MKILKYTIREFKNLFEFYLIPLLVVILPHKIYYPVFKLICRYSFFYSIYAQDSHAPAKKFNTEINDPKIWNRNVKLLYLVDIADSWLVWLRPQKASQLLNKSGQWHQKGGFLALNAHWGAGFISLHDLNQSGLSPSFVFSDAPVAFKDQGFLEKQYRKIRRHYVHKISGSLAIPTGGGYKAIQQKVLDKEVPVILYDAPKNKEDAKYCLTVFGHKYYVASGFLNLILNEKSPFQLFSVKLDFTTGERTLRIDEIQIQQSAKKLIDQLSEHFEHLLIESPEHWFFWRHTDALLKEPAQIDEKSEVENPQITVLAYHSANIAGNEYHNNDHIAIQADLRMIKDENIIIISAEKLVDFLYGKTQLDTTKKYVVLTFDDGNELDFTDWDHPDFGPQMSFYSAMKASQQPVHATAFVIASAETRKTLEETCLGGYPLLGEQWWREAEDTGQISIENHSWDHVHPSLDEVIQKNNEKGDFALIDNIDDAKNQIEQSTQWIESVLKNKSVSLFAYPYGHYNDFLTEEYFPNMQNQIAGAFTCDPEHVTMHTNEWKIPRFVCGLHWKSLDELKAILSV